jgi:citrate synthase
MSELRSDPGLAKTIVADSQMSFIDGQRGVLEYVGIDIDTLARQSTFEETTHLLRHRRLPTAPELAAFTAELRASYDLPAPMWDAIRATPKEAAPMHVLRTMVSALALHVPDPDAIDPEASERRATNLVARVPTLIAAFDRHRKGLDFVPPDANRPLAENFLLMLNGEPPTPTMARALDVCLILHADHGFNASTFAALVTVATLSDLFSAMTTAIGTLKGPLHGGANEAVMRMLEEIGDLEHVDAYIADKLARKERIMGFGHRVYKAYDPRATYLKTLAEQLAADTHHEKLYEMSKRIETQMEEAVGAKGIRPNVDFYSATTYKALGLELDLFTPIFAMSRMAGWVGHCIEQLLDNKLIRPRCDYVGPHDVPYLPIDDRG